MRGSAARVGVSTAAATTGGDELTFPLPQDTAFRCLIALALVRLGMKVVVFGCKRVSAVHPARKAYKTAIFAWDERMKLLPWRGFVPTGRLISFTQLAWVAIALAGVDLVAFMLGLPHIPSDLLPRLLPHVTHHVVSRGGGGSASPTAN